MSDQKFSSPYRRNISDERLLGLSAMNETNKRANWNIRVAGNKLRITVWTGIDGDANNGKQEAVLDLLTGYVLAELIRSVVNSEAAGFAEGLRTLRLGKEGWKGGKQPGPNILVGKDNSGVVFLALFLGKNRPCIKFQLIDDGWFNLVHKGGESFTPGESSRIVSLSYARALEHFVATLGTQEYVETSKERSNNGGGNNYNRNNNNNYGNRNNQQSNNNYQEQNNNNTNDSEPSIYNQDSDDGDDDLGF